ncbi:MAG: alginate lyase family protein [Chloroflexi bacterium]|nr:alginate lyase family protein [Chloroflexota bacterium]
MLNRIKTLASLSLELGLRWSAFRLAYAFRHRSGLIRLQMPQYAWADRPLGTWLKPNIPSEPTAYAEWRKANAPKFFFDNIPGGRVARTVFPRVSRPPIEDANRLLNGELKYFSHEYHQVGFPPCWNDVILSDSEGSLPMSSEILRSQRTLPQNDKNKHWSQISDDYVIARRTLVLPDEAISMNGEVASAKTKSASQRHGDIKFIWEPNRFAFVYTLVRAYAVTNDEKYPQAFWQLIQDWAEHNPPNTGANWKDGQEIALRLMAWTFGFYAFIHSPSTTPQQISQFTQYVAAQAERIYKNIGYAISTRSNHTISEAFGLWMVSLLFPELKDSYKYLFFGQVLLEDQAAKQIFPDGSYSMYSLNYHRFILHLYLYAIQLGKINQSPFSNHLISALSNSISFLSHLINPSTGQMPVYGSNDGALVLPLNNCDFTDYRPLLQLGSVITTGERMFEEGEWDEDVFWLCGDSAGRAAPHGFAGHIETSKLVSFPQGGIYILNSANSRAIIRCTDFRSRPSHADQLHVDLWIRGQDIACDAGTYLYSGEGIWRNGLARTSAHNTVTIDGKDQMSMASRFTWTNWAKGKVLQHGENSWVGEHDGYKPVTHKRKVMSLEGDRWLVVDDLEANEPHQYTLHWLLSDGEYGVQELAPAYEVFINYPNGKPFDSKIKIQTGLVDGEAKFSIVRADPNSTRGWRSRYYGHKEPAISLLLEANQPHACFWTFFGLESDSVEINGNILKLNDTEINLTQTDH